MRVAQRRALLSAFLAGAAEGAAGCGCVVWLVGWLVGVCAGWSWLVLELWLGLSLTEPVRDDGWLKSVSCL